MKRYYCPRCKGELIIPYTNYSNHCPFCYDCKDGLITQLLPIPDWETPSQYEARTGREWKGAVWCLIYSIGYTSRDNKPEKWCIYSSDSYEELVRQQGSNMLAIHLVSAVCADKDVPPDDYKPEE